MNNYFTGMLNGQTAVAAGKSPMWVSQADKYVMTVLFSADTERTSYKIRYDNVNSDFSGFIKCNATKQLKCFGAKFLHGYRVYFYDVFISDI